MGGEVRAGCGRFGVRVAHVVGGVICRAGEGRGGCGRFGVSVAREVVLGDIVRRIFLRASDNTFSRVSASHSCFRLVGVACIGRFR